NMSRYANPDVHELLKDAQTEPDDEVRMELYKKAQEIIHEEAPWIPIIYSEEPLAGTANLQDYVPNPTGSEPFDEVSFKYTVQGRRLLLPRLPIPDKRGSEPA